MESMEKINQVKRTKNKKNGLDEAPATPCQVYVNGWNEHRRLVDETASKLDTVHERVAEIAQHTAYLQKLDPIANTIKLFVALIFGVFLLNAVIAGKDVLFSRDTLSIKAHDTAENR